MRGLIVTSLTLIMLAFSTLTYSLYNTANNRISYLSELYWNIVSTYSLMNSVEDAIREVSSSLVLREVGKMCEEGRIWRTTEIEGLIPVESSLPFTIKINKMVIIYEESKDSTINYRYKFKIGINFSQIFLYKEIKGGGNIRIRLWRMWEIGKELREKIESGGDLNEIKKSIEKEGFEMIVKGKVLYLCDKRDPYSFEFKVCELPTQ
ncbi:MAG TPA: hypothetical protein ENF41_05045 [Candidatus Bathyarchaeota archaeon]|nr:hypothetical protein [Candidatus Bathyarchaeota archaeon]